MSYDYQPRMKDLPLVEYPRQLIEHCHCYPVYLAIFCSIYKVMTRNSVVFRKILRVKHASWLLQLCTLLIKTKILKILLTVMVNINTRRQIAVALYISFALMRFLCSEVWWTQLVKMKTTQIPFLNEDNSNSFFMFFVPYIVDTQFLTLKQQNTQCPFLDICIRLYYTTEHSYMLQSARDLHKGNTYKAILRKIYLAIFTHE
jgi:hypothetical protein